MVLNDSGESSLSQWVEYGLLFQIGRLWPEDHGHSLTHFFFKSLSRVQLFVTPRTVAYQAPLSMGFSRQRYWSGFAISLSRGSSPPRDQTRVSHIAGRHFTV